MQEGVSVTIKQLYDWARENNVEDYTMKVQFRDDGGDYYGEDEEIRCWIWNDEKEVVL